MMTSKRGLVSKVIDGGRNVILDLPKGGSIRAPNMGAFEIGDEVCFTLDATGRRVVLVMPREMAEWHDAKVENEMIQLALKEDQHGHVIFIDDDPDQGQTIAVTVDIGGREPGEGDSDGGDNTLDEHLYADADGTSGEGGIFAEGSGEADHILIPILLGHDDPEEVGNGIGESMDAGGPTANDSEGS